MSAPSALPLPNDPFTLDTANYAHIYTRGHRPTLELPHSFAFLLNVARAGDDLPPIATNHAIRRANSQEVTAIKTVLDTSSVGTDWAVWEKERQARERGGATFIDLPENQWRYFVIPFEGSNNTIVTIERALCLAPFELHVGFTLLNGVFAPETHPMLIYSPGRLFAQSRRAMENKLPFIDIDASTLRTLSAIREQLLGFDQTLFNLPGLILQLLDLEALPHNSRMLFLGYFAILESTLTHQPRKDDTIDSITRQVRQKILLLDNRWQPRLDYGAFPVNQPAKLWNTMYAYRSSLAHGGKVDFQRELKDLVDHDTALALVKQTVKAILRYMLAEPKLLLDLKNC
jgi:hypothetical protein